MTSQRKLKRIDYVMLPIVTLLVIFGGWVFTERLEMRRQIAGRVVNEVASSGALQQEVGSPIKIGFVSGNILGAWIMDGGTADLEIPVSGPNGSGTLLDWSQKGLGGWHICSLTFRPKFGPDVVIAPDEKSNCERE